MGGVYCGAAAGGAEDGVSLLLPVTAPITVCATTWPWEKK